ELHHALPDAAFVSAATGESIDALLDRIIVAIAAGDTELALDIPYSRGDVVSRVHAEGAVLSEEHDSTGTQIVVRLPTSIAGELSEFVTRGRRHGAACFQPRRGPPPRLERVRASGRP